MAAKKNSLIQGFTAADEFGTIIIIIIIIIHYHHYHHYHSYYQDNAYEETANYGKAAFWDDRYANDLEPFEWYYPYAIFKVSSLSLLSY